MRNGFLLIVLMMLHMCCPGAFAQDSQMRTITADNIEGIKFSRNYATNPGAEKNTAGMTCTGTWITCTRTTTANQIITGKASYNLSTSTSGAYVGFSSKTWATNELKSATCGARFKYSGGFDADGAAHYKAYVTLNSVKVSQEYTVSPPADKVTVRATEKQPEIIFPCGDGSYAPELRIEAILSTGAAMWVDEIEIGEAVSVGSVAQAEWVGSVRYVGATNCAWNTSTSSWNNFAADTDCNTPTATGNVSVPGTKIPAIVLPNVKPGVYRFVANGAIYNTGSGNQSFRFYDGTTATSPGSIGAGGDIKFSTYEGSIRYTAPQSNVTVNLQGYSSGGGSALYVQADVATVRDFQIDVYYFPTQSQTAVSMLDSNYDYTSYTPSTQGIGSPTITNCQQARDNTDLLLFCKITLGTRTAAEMRVNLPTGLTTNSSVITSAQVCGWVTYNSSSSSGPYSVICDASQGYVNFGYQSATGGAIVKQLGNAIFADGSSITFHARVPIQGWKTNQNAPLLVGGVATGSQSLIRMEGVNIASNCALTNPTTSGFYSLTSGTNIASGGCTLGYVFSGVPVCVANGVNSVDCRFTSAFPTATALTVDCGGTTTGMSILCIGPR